MTVFCKVLFTPDFVLILKKDVVYVLLGGIGLDMWACVITLHRDVAE